MINTTLSLKKFFLVISILLFFLVQNSSANQETDINLEEDEKTTEALEVKTDDIVSIGIISPPESYSYYKKSEVSSYYDGLWGIINTYLKWEYNIVRYDNYRSPIVDLSEGKIDILLSGTALTPERMEYFDFTTTVSENKLGIITLKDSRMTFFSFFSAFANSLFWTTMLWFMLALFIFGVAFFILERKHTENRHEKWANNLWEGTWHGISQAILVSTHIHNFYNRSPLRSKFAQFLAIISWLLGMLFIAILVAQMINAYSSFNANNNKDWSIARLQNSNVVLPNDSSVRDFTKKHNFKNPIAVDFLSLDLLDDLSEKKIDAILFYDKDLSTLMQEYKFNKGLNEFIISTGLYLPEYVSFPVNKDFKEKNQDKFEALNKAIVSMRHKKDFEQYNSQWYPDLYTKEEQDLKALISIKAFKAAKSLYGDKSPEASALKASIFGE